MLKKDKKMMSGSFSLPISPDFFIIIAVRFSPSENRTMLHYKETITIFAADEKDSDLWRIL